MKYTVCMKMGYVYLESAVGKNEKLESFKLESPKWIWKDCSWKIRAEVGKFVAKLESITEVGKWLMKLESLSWTWKDSMKILFNLARFFPTSQGCFQLKKLLNFILSNLKIYNFSFFPTTRIPRPHYCLYNYIFGIFSSKICQGVRLMKNLPWNANYKS